MERNFASPAAPRMSRPSGFCRWLAALALCLACLSGGSGCSLFVMAGKMLIGDPMLDSDFEAYTKKSLKDKGKKVVIICETPEAIKLDFSSLDVDLLAQLARRLSQEGIEVVSPHKVASWIDDNGGIGDDVGELAEKMEADFVVRVHLDNFDYREENSPNLYRGRASGAIDVFEVVKKDNRPPKIEHVYSKGFQSIYPRHKPVGGEEVQAAVFRKRYLDRLSDEIGRTFYKTRPGSDF
jgi:hypothetical protein